MNKSQRFLIAAAIAGMTGAVLPTVWSAPEPAPQAGMVIQSRAQRMVDRGLTYLKGQQKPDGSWQEANEPPAITAIAIKAFVQDSHYKADEAFLEKGLARLLSFQKPDGSISDDNLATYNTAIAISAVAQSRQDRYHPQLEKALGYLRTVQWVDKIDGVPAKMKVAESDPNYGGFGYGAKGARADLSNSQTALDALKDAGLKPDDPAFKAAQKFLSRAQNNSETNDQKWASDDGGFIYSVADGGASKALDYTTPDGRKVHRSYGSMSYAGLKSMIYAGLSKDDPRVKAAWKWVTHNWTLDENPGIKYGDPLPTGAQDGLFYYYHTLARALHAYGQPIITDDKGVKHDWRLELIEKLSTQQKPDGNWEGLQKWMENKPVLSTAYAVLALQETLEDLRHHPAK